MKGLSLKSYSTKHGKLLVSIADWSIKLLRARGMDDEDEVQFRKSVLRLADFHNGWMDWLKDCTEKMATLDDDMNIVGKYMFGVMIGNVGQRFIVSLSIYVTGWLHAAGCHDDDDIVEGTFDDIGQKVAKEIERHFVRPDGKPAIPKIKWKKV